MTAQAPAFNALLLGDARLPTGAYSCSAGLEPALLAGLPASEIPALMRTRLATMTRLECSAAVQAHRLAAQQASEVAFNCLEKAVAARTPSMAQREVSRTLGRGLLRLGRALELPGQALSRHRSSRGVAMGVLAQALGVNESTCAQVCCYEDMQGIAAAALKLVAVTPAMVTRWVIDIGEEVANVIDEALAVEGIDELPAFSAPWMELHAEQHQHRTRRLFNA